jgi:hypothetical protein
VKKYKTLAELKAAYDSGELGRDDVLVLDNDCSYAYAVTDGSDQQVFAGGGPAELIQEALTLLNIPWEPC